MADDEAIALLSWKTQADNYSKATIIFDCAVIGLCAYGGLIVRRRLEQPYFVTYLFFATWAVIGLLAYSQIIPLDETACEAWFYFPMVGVLGMIGLVIMACRLRLYLQRRWLYAAASLVLMCLGFRTILRGFDYHSEYQLLMSDVAVSKEDWPGYNRLAGILDSRGQYQQAKAYAEQPTNLFPADTACQNLGYVLLNLHDYGGAIQAYQQGLKYGDDLSIYQSLGGLTLIYGNYTSDKQFLLDALQKYPHDPTLWSRLAVLEAGYYQNAAAKTDIAMAARYGSVDQYIYDAILSDQPFVVTLPGESLKVP